MTDTIDLAAIQAAADAALAVPADAAPQPDIPAALQCETGCGRPLNIVLTWVADSETRILCDVCALMMFLRLANDIPESLPSTDLAEGA